MPTASSEEAASRTRALLGDAAADALAAAHVAVAGVGGVGGWCAEALARSGIGRLTLVDDDIVAASNLNRQCPATVRTLGREKVAAMRERILDVAPGCAVTALVRRFETADDFVAFAGCDAVVDAIDSVSCKAELILAATAAGIPIFSSMGAARRTDPARVALVPFRKVAGDGLARALRQRFKRLARFPADDFPCAASSEPPTAGDGKGSLMTVTAAFGMILAAGVLRRITSNVAPEGR